MIENIEGVGAILGVQMHFLKEIKKQLNRIEEKMDNLA